MTKFSVRENPRRRGCREGGEESLVVHHGISETFPVRVFAVAKSVVLDEEVHNFVVG